MQSNIVPTVAAMPDEATPDTLADADLDQKIRGQIKMIDGAIVARDRAITDRGRAAKTITECEKSAVLSAWRAGHFLIEKKTRLDHGQWLPWLEITGISSSRVADYMKLARQISCAGNLKSSIRATLRTLPAPPTAKPKSKPALAVVEPEPVEVDQTGTIETLEAELYDAQERVAIMEEAVDPKSRKAIDKLNNQAELIRTLKASVANWQSRASAARKENTSLKRKIKALETELDRRRPRHAA